MNKQLTGKEDFNGLTHAEDSLPAHWYSDADVYKQELDKIFYRQWIYLCHASTFDQPKMFRRFTIGTQEIFLVRDEHGELRGFHNTCRHRGSAMCIEASGRFPGKLIVCPYHQWAYSLDGKLVKTSSHAEGINFHKDNYPLLSVEVVEWRGAIFACLSDDPPSMEESFERGSDRTENWPMADLVVGHTWTKTMDCNWKVFWENFNECLHCPNVHPELCDLVPMYGRRISYYRDNAQWQDYTEQTGPDYVGGLREGAASWSMSGNASDEPFPDLSDEEIHRGQSYFVSLPSVFIAAHVDYMRTVRILPLGPEQTEISVEWLFSEKTLEREDFNMEDITDFAKLVMAQDAAASELNQKGLRSNKFEKGVLMPEEHYVKSFQDWVRERLQLPTG